MAEFSIEDLTKIILHLNRIAKVNNDELRVHLEIEIVKSSQINFIFTAEETTDNHTFLCFELNNDIEYKELIKDIKETCKEWNWKYVE